MASISVGCDAAIGKICTSIRALCTDAERFCDDVCACRKASSDFRQNRLSGLVWKLCFLRVTFVGLVARALCFHVLQAAMTGRDHVAWLCQPIGCLDLFDVLCFWLYNDDPHISSPTPCQWFGFDLSPTQVNWYAPHRACKHPTSIVSYRTRDRSLSSGCCLVQDERQISVVRLLSRTRREIDLCRPADVMISYYYRKSFWLEHFGMKTLERVSCT